MCSAAAQSPVGVFDSGLGGLTAVRELRRILPGEDIVYFGDTGRVPYGTRSRDTIVEYARQDIAFLLSKGVKAVIAACGTVSSTLPAAVAGSLPVPYMGVVESAAKAAVLATGTGRIGLIGTPATVASGSYPCGHTAPYAGRLHHGHSLPAVCSACGERLFRCKKHRHAPCGAGLFEGRKGCRGGYAHPGLHTLPADCPPSLQTSWGRA